MRLPPPHFIIIIYDKCFLEGFVVRVSRRLIHVDTLSCVPHRNNIFFEQVRRENKMHVC